jgi:hypothetical protein
VSRPAHDHNSTDIGALGLCGREILLGPEQLRPKTALLLLGSLRLAFPSSWRIEPCSPPATWTIEEYTIGDLVSVRPYRGSFEPEVALPLTAAWAMPFERGCPVRLSTSRKGQRHLSGLWWVLNDAVATQGYDHPARSVLAWAFC